MFRRVHNFTSGLMVLLAIAVASPSALAQDRTAPAAQAPRASGSETTSITT